MRHLPWFLAALPLSGCAGGDGSPAGEPCLLDDVEPGVICTVAGVPGEALFSLDGLPATESHLFLPIDVTVGPDGRLYLIDFNNHRLRVREDDGIVHTFAGSGFLGDGPPGPADTAAFNHPTGLTFHPKQPDLLYIAAWHNSRVEKIDLSGAPLQLEFDCGDGSRSYGGDGGPASVAKLDLPSSVVFDDDGTMFISDSANGIVRQVDVEGVITTVAGIPPEGDPFTYSRGYGGDGGPASEAVFNWPFGQKGYPGGKMTRHGRNLYLADTFNHLVRVIDLDTWIIDRVAGTPQSPGTDGDGGPALEARLDSPTDIAVDEAGNVFVADTYNHCVRKIDTSGAISTVAGVCGEAVNASEYVDPVERFEAIGEGGPATEARLFFPYGVEVANGVLYVTDTENHVIRAVKL